MSGHSKWSNIRHQKAQHDKRRGKLFSRLSRELSVAARQGGADPDFNPRLRTAIESARAANMPGDNIQRAVKKGTGELAGEQLEERVYEGYGPAGVALYIEAVTDNRNRTASELRKLLEDRGGHLGEVGSVAWMFQKKGVVVLEKRSAPEEKILEIVLEAGGEDLQETETEYEIVTSAEQFHQLYVSLQEHQIPIFSGSLTMIPTATVNVTGNEAVQLLRLLEALEDHDDVQNIFSNFEMADEIIEKYTEAVG